MSPSARDSGLTRAEVERAGGLVFEALTSNSDAAVSLQVRIEAALRAALKLIAGDPDIATLVFGDGSSGEREEIEEARDSWRHGCAGLLRRAAVEADDTNLPPHFIEAFLVDGVCWVVTDRLRSVAAPRLPALAPELGAVLASYYR
jgi:hypothetical protein